MGRIDQFEIGQKAAFKHAITQDDIKKFVEITGDDNPLHIDPQFAKNTVFKDVVAHGMLSASFISTLIGKHIPGEGALWVKQSINFLLPVRVGDALSIQAEVIKKSKKQNLLTLKVEIKNQHKQLVLDGIGEVKVVEIDAPPSKEIQVVEQKVVLITGASRGIGAATAIHLAKQGYSIALNYHSHDEEAEQVKEQILRGGGKAGLFKADIRDELAVQEMVKTTIRKFGTITALVNNASPKMIPQDFSTLEWEDIQSYLDTLVKGTFICIRAVLDEFLKNKYGAIVNVGSIASDATPPTKLTGYVLAKNALHSLTKSLSVEYGPHGIRLNTVSPGMTDTAMIAEIPEKARLVTAMHTPLRRLGNTEDVAQAIAFLLSEKARYITGETLRVCGGQLML